MTPRGLSLLPLVIAVAFGIVLIGNPAPVAGAPPVQTCTAHNIIGFPYEGLVCGGSVIDGCTPGAIYACQQGPRDMLNNCTLFQACAIGCLTGPNSTAVTANTQAPQADDDCFFGGPPLTLSTNNTLGGNDVTLTATLTESHSPYAVINLGGTGSLVPPLCDVPFLLMAGVNSVSFVRPTAVVSTPTDVNLHVLISYPDATIGRSRNLVSVPSTLTLNPGGTQPPASLASFTLAPSPIGPGQVSVMDVVLSRALARGVTIGVSSSDPSIASVINQPTVIAGCTRGGGALTIQAAKSVPQTTTVTISASAPGQAPLTKPLTVTAGCAPTTCLESRGGTVHGGPCGALPDGCGGTLQCGCDFGETCGGGGQPGICGVAPSLTVSAVSLSPSTVTGGSSSAGTVTLNMAAPPGGAGVFLSSSGAAASVPPSVVVPAGQTSASFTVTTSAVTATNLITISASHNGTASAVLTVNPAAATTPTLSAATVNPTSVVGGTSSTGTVTLSAAAPTGGAAVSLSDNSATATVPASVTVPASTTSANFTVTTSTVTASTSATISAVFAGVTRTAVLTVTPASGGTLPAPTLVSPANDAEFSPGQAITFDWSDVTGAASYTVEIDDSSTISPPLVFTQTVTASQTTNSTLPTTRMWWRVRANDAAGKAGAWSAVRRFEVN